MAEVVKIVVNQAPPPVKTVVVTERITETGSGGDVVGPASATNNNFVSFNGTTGKLIKDSGYDATDFATAAQGALATSALQPGDNISELVNDVPYASVGSAPTVHADSHVTGGSDKIRDATASQDGLMTAAYAATLDNQSGTNTGDQNIFQTIAVAGQSNVVADSTSDTLTLVAGANVTITTDASTDTITIAATGGSGSGDVVGPASSTDNALARFDSTTGKLIQNSTAILDDAGALSLDNGTLTASSPILDLEQTWNNAGVNFKGIAFLVNDTAFNTSDSRLFEISTASMGPRFWILATNGHVNAPRFAAVGTNSYLDANCVVQGTHVVESGFITLNAAQNVWIKRGTGSPEGVETANVGSIFIRTDGGTNTAAYLKESGTGNTGWVAIGNGNVIGPASATDNALARFDSTTGKLIQNSTVILSDAGDLSAVNSIDFTPISAPAHNEGLLYYDTDRKALSYYNNEPDVSMQIGFETWVQVRNSTGSTITNGQVVYLSGATGQRPNAILAQANTLPTSRVIGMATHDIENNSDGIVTVFGTVRDLDTSAFTDGQILYLSATTPGAVTATAPMAPNLTVQIGVVQHAHVTQGTILIHPETDSVDADSIYNGTAAARALIKALDSSTGIVTQTGATTFTKRTLTGTTNEITVTNGDGVSGAPTISLPTDIDLSGKSSLAIPVSATPTVNANGEIALDTTVTDWSHGILKYYGGEELGTVAMPIAQFTSPVNGRVPTYDSIADEFQLKALPVELMFAVSDEATALTTGTAKLTFRMPYAMTLTSVRASVGTAPTGSTLIVDINESGSTILSTKLSIDAGEKTSTTAATPPVISDSALADDAEITIDIDQIGSTIAGAGLKVTLLGTRA